MAALQYVHIPNYHAILFRRRFSDLALPGSLIPRLDSWLRGRGPRWDQKANTWVFPSGARIAFGYLEHAGDEERYQSTDFQFIGFDELTQHREQQYKYMFSRLRRTMDLKAAGVPLRMRGATNPGGPGHEWVKARFLRADLPEDRMFIPAKVRDNPSLDGEEYKKSFKHLDKVTRKRLEDGDWDILGDGAVDPSVLELCLLDSAMWSEGATFDKRGDFYIGYDVGRTKDLAVMWVMQAVRNQLLTRKVQVLHKTPFKIQKAVLKDEIKRLDPAMCCIDKGGIGMNIAEDLEFDFPNQVRGVQLNDSNMGKIGGALISSMEALEVRMPKAIHSDLLQDFSLVKRLEIKNGVPVLKTNRDGGSHADRFWAAALCRLAANGAITEEEVFQGAVPKGRG